MPHSSSYCTAFEIATCKCLLQHPSRGFLQAKRQKLVLNSKMLKFRVKLTSMVIQYDQYGHRVWSAASLIYNWSNKLLSKNPINYGFSEQAAASEEVSSGRRSCGSWRRTWRCDTKHSHIWHHAALLQENQFGKFKNEHLKDALWMLQLGRRIHQHPSRSSEK